MKTGATNPTRFARPRPTRDGDSFRVMNWPVFKPGFHKGQYYSTADCQRVVENFAKYSVGDEAYVKAKGKIGHDDDQSIRLSLGLPSAGRITGCRNADDGTVLIDVENIPAVGIDDKGQKFDLFQAVERGDYNDGSVELDWDIPDPADPSRKIEGPVLTAVAFLGEEQPGVKGLPAPKATFSEKSRNELIATIKLKGLEAKIREAITRRDVRRIRFSEVDPMNRDELIAQLKAKGIDIGADPALANLPDEALAALLKAVPAAAPPPAAAMADETAVDKDKDDMSAKYAELEKSNKDLMSKFGAMEAAFSDLKSKSGDVQQAAAFAKDFQDARAEQKRDRARAVVEKAVNEGRMLPAVKDTVIGDLCRLSDEKKDCFAEGATKGKTPFAVECEAILARPADRRFSAAIQPFPNESRIDPDRRAKLLNSTESGRAALRREAEAARK